MSEELKPCPFCGGEVKIENPTDSKKWFGVVCRNTKNRGGSCAIEQLPSGSKDAAIERWNNRPREAELLATIAELREVLEQIATKKHIEPNASFNQAVMHQAYLAKQALDKTKDIK